MLVANSFDLWQKDTFFAAAEEVQQSADIMESAYRTWERERREGLILENSDELCRELQTALGTAKWQLEEFEKAVRLSYRNRNDDFTMARHRQFVDAIETQISRVETELRESFSKQGNQPLRWVNLNEEECNDLAAFLSGTSGISQTMKDQCALLGASVSSTFQENTCLKNKGCNQGISYHTKGSEDVLASNRDASYVIDIEATESHETRDAVNCQVDRTSGTRRTWSSPEIGTCRIVIPDEDVQKITLLSSTTEATPKEKGSKYVIWRRRCGDRRESKGGILRYSQLRGVRWINKILVQVGGCQRKLQTPVDSNLSSVRYKLALMLTIVLIVPLVLYSTREKVV